MAPDAIILTEAGLPFGLGHVSRMTALSHAMDEWGISPRIIVDDGNSGYSFPSDNRYAVLPWHKNPDRVFPLVAESKIAVVDSYVANEAFYNSISNLAEVCIYFDDFDRMNYPRGFVVNGCLGAERFHYRSPSGADHLLGVSYHPLRRAFWNLGKRQVRNQISRILIVLGGGDNDVLLRALLDSLTRHFPDVEKTVVRSQPSKILDGVLFTNRLTCWFSNLSDMELKDLMIECDVAICGGGQVTYELAATATPMVGIGMAPNQTGNVNGWSRHNAMVFAGWAKDSDIVASVISNVKGLEPPQRREAMACASSLIVDGNGGIRIVQRALKKLEMEDSFFLRTAAPEDIKVIFDLSNDLDVRRNSVSSDPISWEKHVSWFIDRLSNPKHDVFVAYNPNSKFIGQVRFESTDNKSIVSISIHRDFRGRGLAPLLLNRSARALFERRSAIAEIWAYVKPENESSARSFGRAGYFFEKKATISGKLLDLYILRRADVAKSHEK